MGSLVTLHLDNRTGVDELDTELRVYRASYKGRVVETDDNWVMVDPIEFVPIHGCARCSNTASRAMRSPSIHAPHDPCRHHH